MRHRHRRRADRSLTVDFLQMLRGDRRVLGHQERAAHRETGIVIRFRNAGFLQQLQRAAAGADKDVFGVNSLRVPALHVLNRHVPGVVGIAFEIGHLGGGLQGEVVIFLQAADQLAGNFAVVDIGTHRRPGGGHFLLRIATFHHQRRPLFNLRVIGGEFHPLE